MAVDAEVIGERQHLLALAYRMLGTVAEAEDAVQETYSRWYRMDQPTRDEIRSARGWLTRVAGRICLDLLGSARARRERYVGQWLPEPVPATEFGDPATDPAARTALDDSVSTALLLVLEAMTPAERVTFVLHDVYAVPFAEIAEIVGRSSAACRQLASSARARVRREPTYRVSRQQHDRVVRAFAAANRGGDLRALAAVLAPDVVLRSDGGGRVTAARNPVYGPDRVARFLLGALAGRPEVEVVERETADGLGFALVTDATVIGVVTLAVAGEAVTEVRMVLNPDKLSRWNPAKDA
ncbi:RNA polymerase sigma factor SigJ [Actinocatenispora sera]|uniref:RNA polymerase sigma factor SigJ n=1 Tax=Actinocatenispora sera TaxID=390989 RepID=UPI0033D6BB76